MCPIHFEQSASILAQIPQIINKYKTIQKKNEQKRLKQFFAKEEIQVASYVLNHVFPKFIC